MQEQLIELFNYLYISEKPQKADVIIGFGHFDLKIPEQCAQLYLQGYAPKIIFTGGVGAGSAGFSKPEGEEFLLYLNNKYPQIPLSDIIIETQSTNTGDNIRFTSTILAKQHPQLIFGKGAKSAIIVANAYRQRRVWLTCKLLMENMILYNCPPSTSFDNERIMFEQKNEDFTHHILGEMQRIFDYPSKGFIAADSTPTEIATIFQNLNA